MSLNWDSKFVLPVIKLVVIILLKTILSLWTIQKQVAGQV